MVTTSTALDLETIARRDFEAGRLPQARDGYLAASDAWSSIADRLTRHGETAASETFRQNAERARRLADNVIWHAAS